MTHAVVESIRNDLLAAIDPAARERAAGYFREPVVFYGVKTAVVNRIAARYYPEVKHYPLPDFFNLCEELLRSDYSEEAFIVFDWSARLEKRFDRDDFDVLERWLHNYVNNWAKCDSLCNHAVGSMVVRYTEFIDRLKDWTASPNRWVRRGAAVTLVLPARRGLFLEHVFDIAGRLLTDADDLVQKGYGWMLKEASRLHQQDVLEYVIRNKAVMPRTALRYAIEKMPPELRRTAMQRD